MDGFDSDIDIGGGQKQEPHLGFELADIRDRRSVAPMVDHLAVGEQHFLITEIARFRRQAEFLENPGGHGNLAHSFSHDFEDRGLQRCLADRATTWIENPNQHLRLVFRDWFRTLGPEDRIGKPARRFVVDLIEVVP